MKVFIITTDGEANRQVYVSLEAACRQAQVSVASARKGKRMWIRGDAFIRITEAEVIKGRPRGKSV